MNATRFEVVGINDERDYCECCGKKGLRRVVWVRDTETDEVKHFGTTCVLSPVKGFELKNEVKRAISDFENAQIIRHAIARNAYKAKGGQYVGNASTGWKPANTVLYAECLAA